MSIPFFTVLFFTKMNHIFVATSKALPIPSIIWPNSDHPESTFGSCSIEIHRLISNAILSIPSIDVHRRHHHPVLNRKTFHHNRLKKFSHDHLKPSSFNLVPIRRTVDFGIAEAILRKLS